MELKANSPISPKEVEVAGTSTLRAQSLRAGFTTCLNSERAIESSTFLTGMVGMSLLIPMAAPSLTSKGHELYSFPGLLMERFVSSQPSKR